MMKWNEQYHMHHEKEYAMSVIASRRQSSPRHHRSIVSTVLDVLSLRRQRRRLAELDPHLLRDIGITRDSLLHILEDRGVAVKQEDISLAWLLDGIRSGEIVETFACGTAAVITPIGRLASHEFDVTIADGEPGELTRSLYDELTGIQYGTVEDRFNWLYQLA